jgi:regulator of sigma E protease
LEILALSSLDPYIDRLVNILTVAIGLGLVIFFHELGHFAVAKWCNVMVERFSIGFGPILWRRKWGETEYALSAIPFGGYVKMLGQDDIDPGQMTDEQVAADPRSYTSKPVWQRMAIISAGVTMNVITGLMFFTYAFRSGIETNDREVGYVAVGKPAWQHGIRVGDEITAMNGREITSFGDILRQTALSRGDIQVVGKHADGQTFEATFPPDITGIRRMIGIAPQSSLRVLADLPDPKDPIAAPGSAAAEAGFKPGDEIVKFNGKDVSRFFDFEHLLAESRDKSTEITVKRETKSGPDELATLTLPPQPFRSVGLRMSIGKITAVRDDSPAAKAGIEKNDLITQVDSRDVGNDLDPLRLPDYCSDHAGSPIVLHVQRDVKGGEPKIQEITVVPEKRLAWSEPPGDEKSPLSIPSLGLGFEVLPVVLRVNPEGPAAKSGIEPGDSVVAIKIPAEPVPEGKTPGKALTIDKPSWPFVFWRLQDRFGDAQIELDVKRPGEDQTRHVTVALGNSADWYQEGTRGLLLRSLAVQRKAESFGDAMHMSWQHTRDSIIDIYLTLRNLIFMDLSIKSLSGPIDIAKTASVVAKQGLGDFAMFLGLISINLAVINFLPIPVLDGGHMVFLIWEAIARRKPSEKVVVAATYLGFAFVVGLMITVICVDVFVVKK